MEYNFAVAMAKALNSSLAAVEKANLVDQHNYLIIYSMIVAVVILIVSAASFTFFRYCMQVGISLHDKMFSSLVRAPTSFYDTNPSGKH